MKKLSFKWGVLLMALFAAAFLSWSCGGSSGGGTTASQTLTPADIDASSAATVTGMAMSTGDISDFAGTWVDRIIYNDTAAQQTRSSLSLAAWVLEKIREGFASGSIVNENDLSRGAIEIPPEDCGEGGTVSLSGTWTGADDAELCDVSNATITMRFSNCVESGESVNGTISVHISGNLCAATAMSISFNGFSLNSSEMNVTANDFDLSMTALQWSGEDITHMTVTLDGDIAVDSYSMQFAQYAVDITTSGSDQTIMISGSLSGDCLDGWVTFTTLEPVQASDSSECPYGGSVQISGSTDITVVFNSDGSLEVGDQHYASCAALPDSCQ
jgi:hypothetical protein